MTTLLVTHASGLAHDTGGGHPERPDRLRAIERALAGDEFSGLVRCDAPPGDLADVLRAHPPEIIDIIRAAAEAAKGRGPVHLDADTVVSAGSYEAALRAVGGAVMAVDRVIAGEAANAFVAMRPPGHHAEAERPMGFCLFSNAAIAAKHARAVHGLARVAVVDFDVHHGNGTQDIFWDEPDLLYASTHQMPLYPGTGAASETGIADNICNAPLRSGDGSRQFRSAMEGRVLPALHAFAPELIIISAGFDAHRDDPLAGLALIEADFAWVTEKLVDMAAQLCDGRVVSVLEGGYDLGALARSAAAHVRALMGRIG